MKLIPNAASRKLAGQVLLAKKNSPTILFGAGIAGSVASTVLACRATLRLEEVLREAQHDLVVAKEIDAPGYSEGDHADLRSLSWEARPVVRSFRYAWRGLGWMSHQVAQSPAGAQPCFDRGLRGCRRGVQQVPRSCD